MSNPNQNENASAESKINKIENNFPEENINNTQMMNPENPEDMTVMEPDAEEVGGGESKKQSKKKEVPTHTHACYGGCCGHQVTTRKLKPFKFAGHKGRAMLRQICLFKYHYMAIYNAIGDECSYWKYENRMQQMTDWFCDMYNHSKKEIQAYLRHRKTKRTYTTADRNYYVMQYELCPDKWNGLTMEEFMELTPQERSALSPFKQGQGEILTCGDIEPVNPEPDWESYQQERERLGLKKPKKKKVDMPALIASLVADAAEELGLDVPTQPIPVAEAEPVAEAKEDMPEAEPEKKKVPRGKMENNEKTRRILQHIFPEPENGELPDRYTGEEFKNIRIVKSISKHTGNKYTMYLYPRNPTAGLPYIKKPIDAATFERYYEMKPIKLKKAKKVKIVKKPESPPQLMI